MKTYGPYSPYQTAGYLVYTAGQIGANDGIAPKEIAGQTKIALNNLEQVLLDAGSNLSKVVKVTVYLTNMDYFSEMNKVYADVFDSAGAKPARSTVAVKELPRVADNNLLVEIEAVAMKVKS